MKVLMINGSPHTQGCTRTALAEVAKSLGKEGIETEVLNIGTKNRPRLRGLRQVRRTQALRL